MLARKFATYRLHMTGKHKTKQNALFSLFSKILVRLDQNEEKNSTKKKKN